MNSENTPVLDAKGLKCPMPVIKLQQALRALTPGDKICIQTTDKTAPTDVEKWAKVNKHQIIEINETDYGHDITVQHSGLLN